jgi:hypothetical protein
LEGPDIDGEAVGGTHRSVLMGVSMVVDEVVDVDLDFDYSQPSANSKLG